MSDECVRIKEGLTVFLSEKFLEYQKVEIFDLERILGGMETEIHSFTCKYLESGKKNHLKLIIRIYHSEHGFKYAIEEFEALHKLKMVNYPVPNVYFKETSSKYLGKPFLIIEFIEGVLMGDKMLKSGENRDFRTLQILIDQFSKLFVNLHRIDWRKLVNDKDQYLQNPKARIMDLINWHENQIKNYEMNSLLPIVDWLKNRMNSISFPKESLSLVHVDFHPQNIILNDTQPCVIDWHGIIIRDYRTDLGQTSLLIETYGTKEIRDAIFDSYEKQSEKIENIPFFEVLAALIRFYEYFEATTTNKRNKMTSERVRMIGEDTKAIKKVYQFLKERTGREFLLLKETLISE